MFKKLPKKFQNKKLSKKHPKNVQKKTNSNKLPKNIEKNRSKNVEKIVQKSAENSNCTFLNNFFEFYL